MNNDKLKEAAQVLGQEIVNKVMELSDKATTAFVDKIEEVIEEKRRNQKANERKPTREELVKEFEGWGFIVPKDAEFYKVSASAPAHRDEVGHICFGMKVGEYTHSCHIDTMELTVLLIVDGRENWVESFADMWITKLFTA